jgi:hypothetical protein
MATQPQRDLTRRSSAPKVDPISERPVPQTWEEEELSSYEPKRAKAVEEKQRADAKTALLARQLPHQMNALREVIKIRCESLNARARRTILRWSEPDPDHLEMHREDDTRIEVHFEMDKKKVTFSGEVLGYNREFELVVETRNEVDVTTWYSPGTLSSEAPDELVKSMLSILLRANQ